MKKIKDEAEKYSGPDATPLQAEIHDGRSSSVYGFFGKSNSLVESLRPEIEGKAHLSTQLGVPGCGKSTCLKEFFLPRFMVANS